jgi:UDP:flavonoid glycosyltransferase YjiC (YdhE family)
LLNHGYAEQIIQWHKKNPQTTLHCFYDKPGAPPELRHDDTLTFHRLDGEKFLRMMAECKFVACTAGFESLGEAAWLGKPLFLVPVENHIEQEINAIDATRIGLGVADTSFNLDRLAELPERLENSKYRAWLNRADSLLLQALERAVPETEAAELFDLEAEESEAV